MAMTVESKNDSEPLVFGDLLDSDNKRLTNNMYRLSGSYSDLVFVVTHSYVLHINDIFPIRVSPRTQGGLYSNGVKDDSKVEKVPSGTKVTLTQI